MKDLFNLQDKVVLITGGSGHLGSAMSQALCSYGANLIIASRNTDKNQLLCNALNQDCIGSATQIKLDISKEESVNAVINRVIKDYHRIDVLINNSYYGAGSDLLSMTEDEWTKGIDGSINSTFRMTKAVLEEMTKQRSGKIINIASMYGIVAPDVSIYQNNNYYNPGNYGAGKAAIIQFTKYVASVYGKEGITCNCISPGPFPNKEVQKNEEFIQLLEKRVPLNRIGSPDDLMGAIILLASSASNYINGTNLVIDGGWTIW